MLSSKFLQLIGLFFVITACSSDHKTSSTIPPTNLAGANLVDLKKKCDEQNIPLSCAQYGYRVKKDDIATGILYTQKACALKHEESCFNVIQIKDRAIEHNANIIRRHSEEIRACYVTHVEDKDKRGFSLKKTDEQKVMTMQFLIDTKGLLTGFSIKDKKLSDDLKKCVNTIYASRKFIGTDVIQAINFDLVMPVAQVTPDSNTDNNW